MMVRSPDTGSQCAPLLLALHMAVTLGAPQSSRHDAGAFVLSADVSTGAAVAAWRRGRRSRERVVVVFIVLLVWVGLLFGVL